MWQRVRVVAFEVDVNNFRQRSVDHDYKQFFSFALLSFAG